MTSTIEQCAYLSRFDMNSPRAHTARLSTTETTSQPLPNAPKRRIHQCPVATCTKTFRRRFSLKEHVATHTGEKAFVCSVSSCRRGFSTSGNLSRHKRVQHPWLDAPLECLVDDCGCKFASEKKLERHMAMVHFSESSFPCLVKHCGRAFTTAGNLRRHTKQRHGERDSETESAAESNETIAQSPTAVDGGARLRGVEHVHTWHDHSASMMEDHQITRQDAELMDVLSCLFD